MLKDKWALVTGATAGLGLAVAESLADAGANIVLHDLVEPRETRDRLRYSDRQTDCGLLFCHHQPCFVFIIRCADEQGDRTQQIINTKQGW